ncbi:MAG: methyltransferase domain-containing protein [Thaumarchaeota archaeon]|nr:methyltransferase domain-containing protein [Nitrososphaerota archaeon]
MVKTKDELDTIRSFEYQWKNLADSKYLISDETWRNNVDNYILDELGVTRDWIRGKTVIDVGCGGGRWTYGFVKLGCQVTALDVSEGPCNLIRKNVPQAEVVMTDLFELPKILRNRKFDIVWCWGVIHHTNNPHKAFDTLLGLMSEDSLLHLYVYSFNRGIRVKTLRWILGLFSINDRESIIRLLVRLGILHGSIHELFDSLSTQINHEIPETELRSWFEEHNLSYMHHTPQWSKTSRDLFVTGKKIGIKN